MFSNSHEPFSNQHQNTRRNSGAFMGLSFAYMWLVSMYQLWFGRVPGPVAARRAVEDLGESVIG